MQVEGLRTTDINQNNELILFKQKYQQLETENQKLKTNYENQIVTLKNDVIHFENKYLEIKERYDLLIYKRFCRSAEHLADENQQLLFSEKTEIPEAIETNEEEQTEVKSYTRKKSGRKALDPNLPREEKIIDIPESEKACNCGAKLTKIGEEANEKLHIIPQRIYVEKTIRPKYACRCCEGTETEGISPTVRIAPVPPAIIPKSITSPGLLSTIFTQKYEMHLPYYRQEKQFEMIGAAMSSELVLHTSSLICVTGSKKHLKNWNHCLSCCWRQ
jgi:transposase